MKSIFYMYNLTSSIEYLVGDYSHEKQTSLTLKSSCTHTCANSTKNPIYLTVFPSPFTNKATVFLCVKITFSSRKRLFCYFVFTASFGFLFRYHLIFVTFRFLFFALL